MRLVVSARLTQLLWLGLLRCQFDQTRTTPMLPPFPAGAAQNKQVCSSEQLATQIQTNENCLPVLNWFKSEIVCGFVQICLRRYLSSRGSAADRNDQLALQSGAGCSSSCYQVQSVERYSSNHSIEHVHHWNFTATIRVRRFCFFCFRG